MVTYPSDKDATVLIGKETTWGTAVVPAKTVGLLQRCNFTPTNNLRRVGSISTRVPQDIAEGKFAVPGELEFYLQHGRILEYAFGTVTHTPTSTDCKHTFDFADALPSFTIEKSYNLTTDICQRVAGAQVTTCRIASTLDNEVIITAGFQGKTIADSATASASSVDTIPTLKDYMASVTIDALATGVQSWEVNINNNLELLYGIGSRLPIAQAGRMRNVDFRFTKAFDSITEYEMFLGGVTPSGTTALTPKTITFLADNGVALGSGKKAVSILLTGCLFNDVGQPVEFDRFVFADFSGFAKAVTTANTYVVDNILEAAW